MSETLIETPVESLPNENTKEDNVSSKKGSNYILISVLVVILIILLYYAYTKFTDNRETDKIEKFTKKKFKKERDDNIEQPTPLKRKIPDDTVIDYNLRESIDELRAIQKSIMSTLSDTADY